jgi:hypothetical protein
MYHTIIILTHGPLEFRGPHFDNQYATRHRHCDHVSTASSLTEDVFRTKSIKHVRSNKFQFQESIQTTVHPCIENQLDALFILSLFLQSPSQIVHHFGFHYTDISRRTVSKTFTVNSAINSRLEAHPFQQLFQPLISRWISKKIHYDRLFNPLQTKHRPLYLKTQSVPRCKHFSSRL